MLERYTEIYYAVEMNKTEENEYISMNEIFSAVGSFSMLIVIWMGIWYGG